MFLLIDNYDSFTYNLAQAFQSLGRDPVVLKNDDPAILKLAESSDLEMVCISPGPGHPANAGLCPQFLQKLSPEVPVLGICLGHQLLGLHGGGEIDIAPVIMHGKQSEITHEGEGIFHNMPMPMKVGRYHSLVVKETPESAANFIVTAKGPDGEVMGLKYKDRPWVGAQFHPESVLTSDGLSFLANFPSAIIPKARLPFSQILERLANKEDLDEVAADQAFADLMDGKLTQSQAGAFLLGLRMKGESALELASAIKQALKRAVPVNLNEQDCIDVVGTGGDGKNTFNCSTAASLLLAGMGYKVAKHGNRAVSSTCGAADALEGLGIPFEADPAKALAQMDKNNFTFFFAPFYHPAFKNIGPLRKELGVRTLFNILGPMINPAKPPILLMGVARPELVPLVAEALSHSHLHRAAVVCGAGGYDELTQLGPTDVAIIDEGKISYLHIAPEEYGIKACDPSDLTCNSREDAILCLRKVLTGNGSQAMNDMVSLNAALAIYLLEKGISFGDALKKAQAGMAANAGAGMLHHA